MEAGLQRWEFNEEIDCWAAISAFGVAINTVLISDRAPYLISKTTVNYGPNTPYSRANAYNWLCIYNTANVTWDRQFSPPRGVNPALGFVTAESTSAHTFPQWLLPGKLAGHPSVIEEIDARMADID